MGLTFQLDAAYLQGVTPSEQTRMILHFPEIINYTSSSAWDKGSLAHPFHIHVYEIVSSTYNREAIYVNISPKLTSQHKGILTRLHQSYETSAKLK